MTVRYPVPTEDHLKSTCRAVVFETLWAVRRQALDRKTKTLTNMQYRRQPTK